MAVLGNDDLYNSTTNGETTRPVVADPETTEVNQSYVQYKASDEFEGIEELTFRGGRQIIKLDNLRFIGAVDWRQVNQT